MSSENREVMDEATRFARANVVQGAVELREWSQTSILRNGVVRELAHQLRKIDAGNALRLSETVFTSAIIACMAEAGENGLPKL